MRHYPIHHKLLLLAAMLCCSACKTLQPGDLLFHVVGQPNHITDVTPGMIDHVAIYTGQGEVVEAIPRQGVTTTPLLTVLTREDGHYFRGVLPKADRKASVARARRYLGLPYDSLFLPDAGAIYCSELVQLSYVDRQGQQLLQPVPMSFHDSTGHVTAYWQQFYARHGMEVPEGEDGTNPAELSQRPQVIIKKLK